MTRVEQPSKVGTHHGRDVFEMWLISETGVRIAILSYGCVIRDWQIPCKNGSVRSVVCGFEQFENYPLHSPYFGAIVGRVANRIGGSRFMLDGKEYRLSANEGPNHLHGGPNGLGQQVWNMEIIGDEPKGQVIRLTLTSPEGENGYPGKLEVSVVYRLRGNRLTIEMESKTDAPTPINLVQHNYFNLAANNDKRDADVGDHMLWLDASQRLVVDTGLIPTGELTFVSETEMDFCGEAKKLRGKEDENTLSIDNSFVLNPGRDRTAPAAILYAPDRSLKLELWTDQPGIHVYTGGGLNIPVPGLGGRRYPRFGAICLEDQNFPDAVNHSNFPSAVIRQGELYRHTCEIQIS